MIYTRDAQPTARGTHPAPEGVISGPRSRLKNNRNFSWMTEILRMNLNFIELLTILQLITIWNSSDSNNIKPQAIKGLVKQTNLVFYTRLLKIQLITLYSALECTKIVCCGPWPKKVVHLWSIQLWMSGVLFYHAYKTAPICTEF